MSSEQKFYETNRGVSSVYAAQGVSNFELRVKPFK